MSSLNCGCAAPSRRGLMAGAGAFLAAGAAPAALWAQRGGGRIDVHHHFDVNAVIPGSVPPGPPLPATWALQADIEDMEKGGVSTALLSSFAPYGAPPDLRRKIARATNEAAARLAADHNGRFANLATLPLPDIDAALTELAYGLDTLKAHGVCLHTNSGDKWLGDAHFHPLFDELNRRKAVVFVHPTSPLCCRNLVPGVPDMLIEFGADTTRCIASLVFNGTTVRFPDMKFIFCHGGGATSAVIERFLGGTAGELVPGVTTTGVRNFAVTQPPGGVLAELRKLHYDTAQAANPVAMGALRRYVPVSQILYGTDYQYHTAEITSRHLRENGVFDAAELRAIERENALRLFPRLA